MGIYTGEINDMDEVNTVCEDYPCPHCKGKAWAIKAELNSNNDPVAEEDENGNEICRCLDCDKEFKMKLNPDTKEISVFI